MDAERLPVTIQESSRIPKAASRVLVFLDSDELLRGHGS